MMGRFATIGEIDLARPESWEDKLFLTFDIDWASDDVVASTIDLIEPLGVAATWFVTHDTPMLERLRANPNFELGIHPNFNFLLEGDARNGANAEEVVQRLLALVPGARSVRSHAMTQSSNLMLLFRRMGLTHDVNHFIPEQLALPLRPWPWYGLTKVPYFWEDDIYCTSEANSPMSELLVRPGLRVFDFHPIHVFLNTECMSRYEAARPDFADIDALGLRCNRDGAGARSLLMELLGQSE